jgi:CPA1 family monovalent cation:H+ antiporter
MRGAVSLAAALALPQSFPQRDLLVFLTFAVIVVTLVGQGLTLPPLIRRLGLVSRDEQEMLLVAEARRRLTMIALSQIDDLARAGRFPPVIVERIRTGYESQLARIDRRLEAMSSGSAEVGDGEDGGHPAAGTDSDLGAERELRGLVIASERSELDQLLVRRKVSERVAGGVRAALDVDVDVDETTMRP